MAPMKALVGESLPDGRALPLVRVMRPSRSCSQRQLRTPAAAAASAPPPRVQTRRGEESGQPSVSAIPPRVVASRRGIRRGLATSNQGGSLIRFRDGTTSSRVGVVAGAELAMTGLQRGLVENDGHGGERHIRTTHQKRGEQCHQQGCDELMGHGDQRL